VEFVRSDGMNAIAKWFERRELRGKSGWSLRLSSERKGAGTGGRGTKKTPARRIGEGHGVRG
jgi:hypothetical protein